MHISDAARSLDRDLRDIFRERLESVVVYAPHASRALSTPTLAVVTDLTPADLRACATKASEWRERGLATPLLVSADEFQRSLDAFPFEFGAILADHAVVSGRNPFSGLHVDPEDLRRACEVQARGLLLHLREGFIETEGRSDRLIDLLHRSSSALAPLVANVARLLGGTPANAAVAAADIEKRVGLSNTGLVEIVSSTEGQPLTADAARRIFPGYLSAVNRLTTLVDTWTSPS
jgi:hypothetical protein